MGKQFTFHLSDEEKSYLLDLARLVVVRHFNGHKSEEDLPPPPTRKLHAPLGAFVTLKEGGRLRGCIGRLANDAPLFITVARMAVAAAFNDPRFPALQREELGKLEFEISILSPITPCQDPTQVVIGRHGLIMKKGPFQGLLLPQVPEEWGWGREQFLAQTCRKAGLPPEAWKEAWKDGQTELHWFEAEVF